MVRDIITTTIMAHRDQVLVQVELIQIIAIFLELSQSLKIVSHFRKYDLSILTSFFSGTCVAFDPNNFGQIIQDVIQNMGDLGRNATVMSRTSDDGSSVDVSSCLNSFLIGQTISIITDPISLGAHQHWTNGRLDPGS